MIHFVGAGPGAPDLITLRGAKLLGEAGMIIYAGSLVNPELLKLATSGCEIYNSASMTLDEVIEKLKSDFEHQSFEVSVESRSPVRTSPDVAAMIEREKKKLSRVREAYEAGIDSLEEYRENKQKIQSRIDELTAQAEVSAPRSEADIKKLISGRIKAGLDILESDETSETLKNMTLRSFVDRIIFMKPKGIVEIFYKL